MTYRKTLIDNLCKQINLGNVEMDNHSLVIDGCVFTVNVLPIIGSSKCLYASTRDFSEQETEVLQKCYTQYKTQQRQKYLAEQKQLRENIIEKYSKEKNNDNNATS
jgi:hypothetical protein